MNSPSVSIVVPIYNVERYLDECLLSIKNQSLHDIEVILVDDGSTDSSLQIAEKYVNSDPRFKVISKKNSGYGDTMNCGFEMATGKYLGIVESDDYVEPDMFETLFNAAESNNCQIVKSDYYEFTTSNKSNPKRIRVPIDYVYYGKVINRQIVPDIYNFAMNTWTGVYLTEFIRSNGIQHNVTPGAAYQDNGFWFQTITLADRIMFVDRAFYHYRQDNPNSSINSKGKVFCMCDEYEYIAEFMEGISDPDGELRKSFLVKRYFNYMYTYGRVAEEYKVAFLERFAEDFKDVVEDGSIDSIGNDLSSIVRRIVADPKLFHYENSIWESQHNAIEKALDVERAESGRLNALLKGNGEVI